MAELAEKVLYDEPRDCCGGFVAPYRFMDYCKPNNYYDDRVAKAEQNCYNIYGR